jgi:hypothetical protein
VGPTGGGLRQNGFPQSYRKNLFKFIPEAFGGSRSG